MFSLCPLYLTSSPLSSTMGLIIWDSAFGELYPSYLIRICVHMSCTQWPFPFQSELIFEGNQTQIWNEG